MMTRLSAPNALVMTLMVAGALFAGCGDDGGSMTDMDGGTSSMLTCEPPTSGFGTSEGRKISPLTLRACDGSAYEFYNQDYCDAELTVMIMAAGWCNPCIQESMAIESDLNDVYGDRVRVIQVIIQKEDGSAPDAAYCSAWRDRFGLSNIVAYDANNATGAYFNSDALPTSMIIDGDGTYLLRTSGISSTGSPVSHLTEEIDRLLAR